MVKEPAELRPNAQERDEVPLRKLLLLAFGTIAVFGGGVAVAGAPLGGRHLTPVPPPTTTVQSSLIEVTAPGLQRTPAIPLDKFGWADRDGGVAIIPIDRGIEMTLKERR